MIHHISISAHQPQLVAQVLAQLVDGQCFAFPSVEGGFIVLCEDGHATGIEVYPLATQMIPRDGEQAVGFAQNPQPPEFIATHAAISVSLDEASIKEIAKQHGWRAVTCSRGGIFHVVEFWVENRILLELLTPAMAAEYVAAITPQKWTEYLTMPKP